MTRLTLSKALNEGLRKALENDPKVLVMGEDVGKLGGVFRVTDRLQKDFGGLRVVACGDPADAYAMIQQSITCDDPVIFFEPKRRYWDKAEVDTAGGLAGALPLEAARTVAEGTDVTVLT